MTDRLFVDYLGTFYFDGKPRFEYIWDNPNFAGAAIACALPCAWLLADAITGWHAAVIRATSTFVLFALVVATYSRGAILGLGACILARVLLLKTSNVVPTERIFRATVFRIGLLLFLVLASGSYRRFTAIVGVEPSAYNRLDLWKSGLHLISLRPLTGWGKGTSGFLAVNWFQSPSNPAVHYGMVNSYLHLSTEYGLPAMAAFVFLLLIPALMYPALPQALPRIRLLGLAAATCCISFSVSSFFSTLWHIGSVVFIPALLLSLCLYCGIAFIGFRQLITIMLKAGTAALVFAIATAILALSIGQRSPLSIDDNDNLVWRSHETRPPISIVVAFDFSTHGVYYGKRFRSLVSASISGDMNTEWLLFPPEKPLKVGSADAIIVCGPRLTELPNVETERLILLCPTLGPCRMKAKGKRTLILLDEADPFAVNAAWRNQAKRYGYTIRMLSKCMIRGDPLACVYHYVSDL